jgi:hypothetical protein
MKTHDKKNPQKAFSMCLVLLPAVITVIIILVGNSVARAFSLAGAFSIIRFRSTAGDPKDITYILFTMAIGLACGMGYILLGVFVGVLLLCLVILLEVFNFGTITTSQKLLKITIPENLDYEGAFDSILEKYTLTHTLQRIKTTELGSLYELSYIVNVRNTIRDKDFIDELRCRNGNLTISLSLVADDA